MKPQMNYCKACYNGYRKYWNKTEKGRESIRRYREANKEKLYAYYKDWYKKTNRHRPVKIAS